MPVPPRDRFLEYPAKVTSGALALTTTFGEPFRISSVRVKIDAIPTTSENISVSVDSVQDDTDYDAVLFTQDPAAKGNKDIVWIPDQQEREAYRQGNHIKVDYPNTDGNTVTAVVVLERLD